MDLDVDRVLVLAQLALNLEPAEQQALLVKGPLARLLDLGFVILSGVGGGRFEGAGEGLRALSENSGDPNKLPPAFSLPPPPYSSSLSPTSFGRL